MTTQNTIDDLRTTDTRGRAIVRVPEGWRVWGARDAYQAEPLDYDGDAAYSPTFRCRADASAWARLVAEGGLDAAPLRYRDEG